MSFLKQFEQRLRWKRKAIKTLAHTHEQLYQLELQAQLRHWQEATGNPLCLRGAKAYSQGDEDGITLEILRRIGRLQGGTFAEFGVGDGTENNTLVLAALGWHGFWVGGEDLVVQTGQRLRYLKAWITLDNVLALAQQGLKACGAKQPDVLSLDLDGNDLYFVRALLEASVRPALFIVEYNAKFPPPVEFCIEYDARHQWQHDDYFGASLASYARLFEGFGYRLVACNALTGCNAFFIDTAHAAHFADVPTDLATLYVPPRYWAARKADRPESLRTINRLLADRPDR